jgi:hypothetical protein
MDATCISETSVDFQQTTQHYIPEEGTLHNDRCNKLKSSLSHVLYLLITCSLNSITTISLVYVPVNLNQRSSQAVGKEGLQQEASGLPPPTADICLPFLDALGSF